MFLEKRLGVMALTSLLIAAPQTLWAQGEAAFTLDPVVVTALRGEESKKEVTTNITVIDSKTVEASSARTLDELLGQQGFKINKQPGTLSTVQIRGFSTDEHGNDLGSHVLILLNGRRLGTGNTAMIGLANVDRVEIIRGPVAVQYGAAAMGGVINVITKKGLDQPFKASVEVGGGSFDLWQTEAKFSGSSGQFDFAAGFNYTTAGDYKIGTKGSGLESGKNGGQYDNTGYDDYYASLDVGYNFLDVHRIGFSINYFDSPDSGSPNTYQANAAQDTMTTDKRNYSVGLDYTGASEDKRFSWLARYSFGNDRRFYDYHDPAENSLYNLDSQTGQAQLTFDNGLVSLTGGVDYLQYKLDNNENAASSKKFDYENIAPFALAKFRLLDDKVILSAGGRYDHFKLTSYDNHRETTQDHFSPSVGIAWLPTDWLKIRAHYAQAFTMPTDTQLGANFVYWGWYYIGNPNLDPETSNTYEIGFDLMGDYSEFNATYFYTKTKNFIQGQIVNTSWGTEYHYSNMDQAYRTGLELAASLDLGAVFGQNYELRPYVNLTHMFKYESRATPQSDYQNITEIPETIIGAGFRFHHPDSGFLANLSGTRYGKEYSSATAERKPYTIVDLALRKRLIEFNEAGQVDVKFNINNLFDQYYTYSSSDYIMPGRNFYLGLVYSY